MAKCSICNIKKGKRICKAYGGLICDQCCGKHRTEEKCAGCSYYKDASLRRNYRKVPFYSVSQMANSAELSDISFLIESTLIRFDIEKEGTFRDSDAIKLIEIFFNKYHFKDPDLKFTDSEQKFKFKKLVENFEISDIQIEKFIKVMASIYRSIQRRTKGNREYLDFIIDYIDNNNTIKLRDI